MSDVARLGKQMPSAKPSKYRNVKVTVDGRIFDSKHEADVWLQLKARALAGEISELERQVPFPLYTVVDNYSSTGRKPYGIQEDSRYIADFVYFDRDGKRHVVDAKSKPTRTALYQSKKRRLQLQEGLEIEEV